MQGVLEELRQELKSGAYRPLPARERLIPKRSGKLRSLGISTVRDRIVQTAAKLVLEPIFEADFCPTSYGFRPGRRAQDAIEEVRFFINAPRSYQWVIEGDVEDCFGSLQHGLVLDQVRRRVTDKRVLALIRRFLARLEREEIVPTVPPVPDTDLEDYVQLIERRFSNPTIGDTIPRLCQDGSNRQPKFILPAAAARLDAGKSVTGLALVSALWCRFCAGTTDSGKPTKYNDASAERLKEAALRAKSDPPRLPGHGGHLRRGRPLGSVRSRLRRPSGGLVAERRP